MGGTGTIAPLPQMKDVTDLDDPNFTYPIITGDYELGRTVAPWKHTPVVDGTPIAKPHPLFAKIPREAVQEELDRFKQAMKARKEADKKQLAEAKKELAAKKAQQ